MYRNNVEQYRSCIEKFVKEQQRAIEAHTEAAERAIREWNDFVERG